MAAITEQQRRYFQTFGFPTLRRHLSAAEMVRIDDEFSSAMRATLPSKSTHDGRSNLNRLLMDADTPLLASLADDQRFADTAEQLLPTGAICVQVAGYFYMGATRWHSDNYNLGYSGVKFVIYLDPLDGASGALRVLPGSHRNPLWQDSWLTHETEAVFGVRPDEMPAHVCETKPGDVVAFQHALWHASFHGGAFRRMLEINYYADPATPEAVRSFAIQMRRNHTPSAERGQHLYPRSWRSSTKPRHRAWIARLQELDALETPGVPPLDG